MNGLFGPGKIHGAPQKTRLPRTSTTCLQVPTQSAASTLHGHVHMAAPRCAAVQHPQHKQQQPPGGPGGSQLWWELPCGAVLRCCWVMEGSSPADGRHGLVLPGFCSPAQHGSVHVVHQALQGAQGTSQGTGAAAPWAGCPAHAGAAPRGLPAASAGTEAQGETQPR